MNEARFDSVSDHYIFVVNDLVQKMQDTSGLCFEYYRRLVEYNNEVCRLRSLLKKHGIDWKEDLEEWGAYLEAYKKDMESRREQRKEAQDD
jgi:hypothetical protein